MLLGGSQRVSSGGRRFRQGEGGKGMKLTIVLLDVGVHVGSKHDRASR